MVSFDLKHTIHRYKCVNSRGNYPCFALSHLFVKFKYLHVLDSNFRCHAAEVASTCLRQQVRPCFVLEAVGRKPLLLRRNVCLLPLNGFRVHVEIFLHLGHYRMSVWSDEAVNNGLLATPSSPVLFVPLPC